MPRSTRRRKNQPEDPTMVPATNPIDTMSEDLMEETEVYTPEVVESLSDTAEALEALTAEQTEEPIEEPGVDVPVDIDNLTPEQRLAVLEKLLTAQREQRAQEKAERAARKAERDSGQSERVARDAEMLTDIATRLLTLDPVTTESDPVGFRRYTGSVTVDGVELRITATARVARKRGRPRKVSQSDNSQVPEDSEVDSDFDSAE